MRFPAVTITFFVLLNLVIADKKEKPCKIAFRCSTKEDPVWTTDGKSCFVLRNGCFLSSENCDRQNEYLPDLEVIPKEKCQSLCSVKCPGDKSAICGYYNDEKRTFENQCEMDKYICESGETYNVFGVGPCEQAVNA